MNENFYRSIASVDPELTSLINEEAERQEKGIELIPSENFVPLSIFQVNGSVLTNKYAEGTPGKRYYGGCEVVDKVEVLAQERAKKLFNAEFANVQPHSGATANQAVFEALIKPGDTVMGLRLDHGGHLTHGHPMNFSGKHYKVVAYSVRESDHLIDPDEVMALAKEHRPKLIISGASAYPRAIDFSIFRRAADEVGALHLADIAHYSGLIAAGLYPSPSEYADVITTTTHKTLRGPRSGLILSKEKFAKDINRAVFPGLQGGPHMHTIGAKAVCFKLAMESEFKVYAKNVIENAKALAEGLKKRGFALVSGGTDSHLVLVDVRPLGITGKEGQALLDAVAITANKNTIPYDPQPPLICSGVRLGTPAMTTRGMGVKEMDTIAELIFNAMQTGGDEAKLKQVKARVYDFTKDFPLYKDFVRI